MSTIRTGGDFNNLSKVRKRPSFDGVYFHLFLLNREWWIVYDCIVLHGFTNMIENSTCVCYHSVSKLILVVTDYGNLWKHQRCGEKTNMIHSTNCFFTMHQGSLVSNVKHTLKGSQYVKSVLNYASLGVLN